jgi:hypothetical protein
MMMMIQIERFAEKRLSGPNCPDRRAIPELVHIKRDRDTVCAMETNRQTFTEHGTFSEVMINLIS